VFYLFPSELTVRTDPSGGDLTQNVISGTTLGLQGRNRVILLLHGYANSVDDARKSYGRFLDNLQSQFQSAKGIVTDVFRFFWPGDEKWPGISQLSYPLQIESAYKSGQMLAEYLNSLSVPSTGVIELYLITHSLGGRVGIELLRHLYELKQASQLNSHIIFRGFIMMAAAVQQARLGPGGDLNSGVLLMSRRYVLYSPWDTVLHFAFPTGQTATPNAYPGDHEGIFPEAVGRFGNPRASWTVSQSMYKYEHSDYWPRATTSEPVAQFFGIVIPNRIASSQMLTNGVTANYLGSSAISSQSPG
jgi:hypothetical protein